MPVPRLYEECLEGSRRVVLLLLRKHPPICDGQQPQVTVSHLQGLAAHQTLGAFGVILTISKNCNVKPVYIENGQGKFCPYSGGCQCGRHVHEMLTFSLAHDFCGRRCAQEFNNNGQLPSPPPRDVMCIIPGCRKGAFIDADGNATKFCSHRHRLYVSWMVTSLKLLLIQHATNSAAVQRGLADVCLLCVALRVLSDTVLNQRFSIVARICQQLKSVTSKATFVPNVAAWQHLAEVRLPIARVGSYYLFDLLHLSVPMILEVPIRNAKYKEGKPRCMMEDHHAHLTTET